MSIKYALLGLMRDEPMHGYRVKETFDRRVGALWGLTRPQIYQTLNALERAGLLTSHGERVGSRPARRIYTLTDLGRRAFERWLDSGSVCRPRPFRADLLLRLLFVRERDVAPIAAALERAEQRTMLLMDRITRIANPAARDGGINVGGMLRAGAVRQAEADLDLVRRCRREIARWSGVAKRSMNPDADGERPQAWTGARRFGARSAVTSTASPVRRRSAGAQ
jgi:DNA-binding PadR family transcriptional regulator